MPANRSKFFIQAGLILLCFQVAVPATPGADRALPTDEEVPNVVVVGFKDSAAPALSANRLQALGAGNTFRIQELQKLMPARATGLYKTPAAGRLDNIYFIRYDGSAAPETVAKELGKDPSVEFAEPKYIRRLYAIPNDSLYEQQYDLPLMQMPGAWDLAKGENGDVVVAIIDGGTDITHPDLAANLWTNPDEIAGNGIDDDNNGFIDDIHGARMYDHSGDPTRPAYLTFYGPHGTHTAGLACGVTDNNIGIAGASWNARLMPVHTGSATDEDKIVYGFEGILYALDKGARILSCSWGGSNRSEYESRVVDYLTSLGAVMVAAYGNDSISSESQYPAAYPGVIGVAASDRYDRKASFSSYGYSVDVCAPGENILSCHPFSYAYESGYGTDSGTSMSTPLVAGAIALVLTQHPQWTARQAAEQVRATCDNLDALNSRYAGKLGRGRVNAYRALTESTPAIRLEKTAIIDDDGVIRPGEKIKITVTLKNYLAAAGNVSLNLSDKSSYVTITDGTQTVASVGTLQQLDVTGAFEFQVAANTPSGHTITFVLDISAGDYHNSEFFTLTVLPSFGNLSINHVATSVSNIGRIGFGDPNNGQDGIGFKYLGGPNLLCEGAIICGTGPDRISNAARGIKVGQTQINDDDFLASANGNVSIIAPGSRSDEESLTAFEDKIATNPMNILISQQTFAINQDPYRDIILFRYVITNQSLIGLTNFCFGLYFDWDLDGGTFATNVATYDSIRRLGIVYDTGKGPDTNVGVQLLTAQPISYRAIYNDPSDPGNPSWGLHDGFTDSEKWQAISGGLSQITAGPADISNVIAAGPLSIPANGNAEVVFALMAAPSKAELLQTADRTAALWKSLFPTPVENEPIPEEPWNFTLGQNYPNPFNPETSIRFTLPAAGSVELAIFDLTGRRIRTLIDNIMPAGTHSAIWDGRNDQAEMAASGSYFYVLQSGSLKQVRRMILLH